MNRRAAALALVVIATSAALVLSWWSAPAARAAGNACYSVGFSACADAYYSRYRALTGRDPAWP